MTTTVPTLPRDLRAGDRVMRTFWIGGMFPDDRPLTIKIIEKFKDSTYGGRTRYKIRFVDVSGKTYIFDPKDRLNKLVGEVSD